MRLFALIAITSAMTVPAIAQPRAPVLDGLFHGVASAEGSVGRLDFTPALGQADRRDVLRLQGAEDPAVHQTGQTLREASYDLASPAGARIAEVCAGPCRVTGVIEWREPNDWWFREVLAVERLPAEFDFGALTIRADPVRMPGGRAVALTNDDPLRLTLLQSLQAEMEAQIGQPLRIQPLVARRQGVFAYVVVQPGARDGGEVDFEATRWRDQWRYGPWDGGIIHALFRNDGERWSLDTFVISPVTENVVGAWVSNYRAPAALFDVDARQLEAAAAR